MPSKQQIIYTARKFNVKTKKVFFIKTGVYRLISTRGKLYCLKCMRYSPQRLRWMDRTLQKLKVNGFSTVAWRDPQSITGKTLFIRTGQEQTFFILTPWIQGREPSTDSPQDLHACAKTLALFHRAGQKISIPTKGAPNMLGRWPKMLNSKAHLLLKYIQKSNKNESSPALTQLFQIHGAWLLDRADKALKLLDETNYSSFCWEAAKKVYFVMGIAAPKILC